ncbi:hypothetical protein F4808DRAFT_421200 [Astrocystis sublimbata]|nr:hypothetical protein F4808DRAFT_421200 [Astrocystis sublimbata]
MQIQNNIVVITGGLSGLGAATANLLHEAGAYVAIIDLGEPQDNDSAVLPRAKYFKADITNSNAVEWAVKDIVAWSGNLRCIIVATVCCAGFLGPAKILSRNGQPIQLETFKRVVDVSLTGTVDVVRQLLPAMAAQTPDEDGARGVIITVSSAAAFDGQEGQVAYSAAKGAIASMTLPMARDLATYGIRVVCIAPGLFVTGMTATMPQKAKLSLTKTLEFPSRPGKPYEFAKLVKHVIGNHMLNGTVLRLDGGARMPSRL